MSLKRPQVLLVGNGLSQSFSSNSINWTELLIEITDNQNIKKEKTNMPFGLEAVLRTYDNVQSKMPIIQEKLYHDIHDENYICVINEILSMGFDEIITTNYDLDIESCVASKEKISFNKHRDITHNIIPNRVSEGKYFIHTAQHLEELNDVYTSRLWHIHGHIRNMNSIVLGHSYYGRLLTKYVTHIAQLKNDYEKMVTGIKPLRYNSWLDAFILGDVYILGFGFNFSEIDMWWLLDRKAHEKDGVRGKTIFYEPVLDTDNDNKKELLSVYKTDVRTLDTHISKGESYKYAGFYKSALQDIKGEISLNDFEM